MDWTDTLLDQWSFHWDHQLRDRLAGLSDEEYLWEPVPGCWSVRPRGTSSAQMQGGVGAMTIDFAFPEPEPAPVTTIAWQLGHVVVGVLAARNASHFGAPPASYESWEYAADAATALAQLDEQLATWVAGVRGWGESELAAPIGEAEPFPDLPRAALVLHIHRELIHHLSEVALLRDLFAHTARSNGASR
jgi:hypothetical protein